MTASDHMFRLLVQSVSDCAIYMLDLDGHVTNWIRSGADRGDIRQAKSSGATFRSSTRPRTSPPMSRRAH